MEKALKCNGQLGARKIQLIQIFCQVNKLPERTKRIVISAGFDNYDDVIKECKQILRREYSVK